ncbi:MAG: leucine--tRNA ligase [Pyrinomonadaceae bacterium]
MDEKYFAKKIEQKWQRKWSESGAFEVELSNEKPKFYQLEMLPYPSGNLHMGHVRNYSAGDALAWYKRLRGFNVLHPIGWDSFGQPAEDAAVKRGVNPRQWTEDNIVSMQGQLKRLGLSYDWRRQMFAHRPEYYKWDQWFFLKMYEMDLAYKKVTRVNWCPHDQAVLSNEQASGGLCWRCGNPVTKKELEQWFLKTTAYTGQLLDDMTLIESGWPAHVLKRQSDWIGRSEGAFVDFEIEASGDQMFYCPIVDGLTSMGGQDRGRVRVFTTRIDTIYGANAIVLAAEHPVIQANIDNFSPEVGQKIAFIRAENAKPRDHEEEVEKDGIDTGLKAVNPFSKEALPVWVANYVLMEYGTGAVMAVPAHDERDFEFALKFALPIRKVIEAPRGGDAKEPSTETDGSALENAFAEYGILTSSGDWSGSTSEDAKREMAGFAETHGFGEPATTYRLRDWGISRQRFWGSPIPIVYCQNCGTVPEKYENLPIKLPETAPFTGTGESPLAKVPEFFETSCPKCDGPARRETDTMDTFVDSSWYYYRYTDSGNNEMPFDPAVAAFWTPVDQYIGGDDHAVMHLIYARFWTKVLRDIEMVNFDEPFRRLLTQGMVVGETFFDDAFGKRVYHSPESVNVQRDGKGRITSARSKDGQPLKYAIERMSKSKGNGVDPDEMVEAYGADAARLFTLFAAPIENELVWNEAGIEGAVRFLQRVWRLVYKWRGALGATSLSDLPPNSAADSGNVQPAAGGPDRALRRKTHQTIKRVMDSLETLQFNTPVAALMELVNTIGDFEVQPDAAATDDKYAIREALTSLVLMLTPFSPHAAEELYSVLIGNDNGIVANDARFPDYSADLAKEDEIEIAVQINGKLRGRVFASPDASNDELEQLAFADGKVREHTEGKDVVKVVVVPKRLVNIVVKG